MQTSRRKLLLGTIPVLVVPLDDSTTKAEVDWLDQFAQPDLSEGARERLLTLRRGDRSVHAEQRKTEIRVPSNKLAEMREQAQAHGFKIVDKPGFGPKEAEEDAELRRRLAARPVRTPPPRRGERARASL